MSTYYRLAWFMVFNATFNNISAISWRSVLLVEETRVHGKKNTNLLQVTDKFYHIMLYTLPWSRFELTTSVVIGTDCTDSCKSNYHMIMATTAPLTYNRIIKYLFMLNVIKKILSLLKWFFFIFVTLNQWQNSKTRSDNDIKTF